MKTQAAVLFGEGREWEVVELELDPPRDGEVLVRFEYTGLCHSDEHLRFGAAGRFPIVGGHEGAGIVEEIGTSVVGLRPGDHVVTSFVPACGRCRFCITGAPYLCDLGASAGTGMLPDGTFRFHHDKDDLGGFCMLGSFSQWAVVRGTSLVRIDEDIPLDVACLLGCGVPTGWGTAVNAAKVTVGEVVAIYGVGGVGSFALQGALMAGASTVVCIDPQALKLRHAEGLGAHFVFSSASEAEAFLIDHTAGVMADKVIVTAGVVTPEIIGQAFNATRKGGTLVVTGMAHGHLDPTIVVPGNVLSAWAKTIVGCLYGACNPQHDIPRLLGLWRRGQLQLEEAITARYDLGQINEGYRDLADGKNIRGLVHHSH